MSDYALCIPIIELINDMTCNISKIKTDSSDLLYYAISIA